MSKSFIIFLVIIFFLSFAFAIAYTFLEKETKNPVKLTAPFEVFEIKEGDRTRDIAKKLKNQGLIKNDLAFIFYVFKSGKGRNLLPGKYCLSSSQNIPQILESLIQGPTKEEIKLTFPEGWRLEKIEERLSKYGLIEKGELSSLKIKDVKEKFKILEDFPNEASLEGVLFPDTYIFPCPSPQITCKGKTPEIVSCQKVSKEIILNKFLSNFEIKVTPLLDEIKKQGRNLFEVITLASIVEKEVSDFEERKVVAGIFLKRIKEGKKLDSCSTIAYILKKEGWTFEEMRKEIAQAKDIDSPYNTYKYPGLPPGPISNPGLAAIKATVYPKETEFYYFLTDPQTGKTIFSRTLEEQGENTAKYFSKEASK
jgi:UPF0755 protein